MRSHQAWLVDLDGTLYHPGPLKEAVERIVREWMQERPGKWIYRFRRTGLRRQIAAYRAAGGRTDVVAGDEFVHDPFWRASLSRRVQFGLVRLALQGRGVGQQSGGAEWRPR